MSKGIYNGKAQPQKLYAWGKLLNEKGYIKKIEKDRWQSMINPLLSEIESRLKEKKKINALPPEQKIALSEFLDGTFRHCLSKSRFVIKEDFNAIETLLDDLDMLLILADQIDNNPSTKGMIIPQTTKDYFKMKLAFIAEATKIKKEVFKITSDLNLRINTPHDVFLPRDILTVVKGISRYGEKYEFFANSLMETYKMALTLRTKYQRRPGFR